MSYQNRKGARELKLESGDIIVIKVADKEHKSRVSKVDGNVVKLIDENGSYRQMATKDLEEMVEKDFVFVEKSNSY